MYGDYGIAFDGADSLSFSNAFTWCIVIVGVDNSWSSHTDDH